MTDAKALLIVEDSDEDFALALWALRRAGCEHRVQRAAGVSEALALLAPEDSLAPTGLQAFAVILLDLNLPDGTGLDLLSALRADYDGTLPLPIIMLTTSSNPRDIACSYRLGAAGYLVKPLDRSRFAIQIQAFVDYWLKSVTLPPLSQPPERHPG